MVRASRGWNMRVHVHIVHRVYVIVPKIRLLHDTHTSHTSSSYSCPDGSRSDFFFQILEFWKFFFGRPSISYPCCCGITNEHVGRRNRCRWVEWNWKWKENKTKRTAMTIKHKQNAWRKTMSSEITEKKTIIFDCLFVSMVVDLPMAHYAVKPLLLLIVEYFQ